MQQDDLQNLIAQKILGGKSHQEIYEELDAAFPGRELDIAGLIAELPTRAQRKQYGLGRYLLLVLAAAGIVLSAYDAVMGFKSWGFELFPLLESVGVLAMTFFATLIVRWRSTGFKVMGYLGGIMLGFSVLLEYGGVGRTGWAFEQMIIFALLSIVGLYLGYRLGGKYKSYAPSTQVRNANGEIRTRFKIKFIE